MPKVRHIARFTPLQKMNNEILQATNQKETTPIRRTLPDKLRSHIEELRKDHVLLLDLIALTLEETDQPLTVTEVSKLIEIKLDKHIDANTVRLYLQELQTAGRVSSRTETSAERSTRAAGGKARALHAKLWWAPAGEVPTRTITEAVPGVILNDAGGRSPGRPRKKPAVTLQDVTSEDTLASMSKNPVIDYLIEKIVAERTSSLQEELVETRAELERLQRKIRNLVGDV